MVTTEYGYTVLGDLAQVSQGAQSRTFGYDSLRRLTSAQNPESGTTWYAYDLNGNLLTKGDARGITTTMSYDALDRITAKSYSSGDTPDVAYTYDACRKGWLCSVSNGVSTTSYLAYDALGRVLSSRQSTGGINYNFSYTYDLADNLTQMVYPSGRVVNYTYDEVGHALTATGMKGSVPANYVVTKASYWPHGAVNVLPLANGVTETATYNSRLQLASLVAEKGSALLSLTNTYAGTSNNGNVLSQAITAPGFNTAQSFGYDGLGRLTSASEGGTWAQSYNYDQYGNLTISGSNPVPSLGCTAYTAATNRCTSLGYDAVGNVTGYGGRTLTYDAENRQITLSDGGTYYYDGDGRRVKKVVGTKTTVYVYDASGQLAAEYTNEADGNQPACTTCFLTADHLGSTRLITDETGATAARYDYYPFGWEINRGTTDWSNPKFTGQLRDYESGLNLDHFGARYFASAMGRFASADPLMASAHIGDPQSWNRYTYGLNNPLRFTDPLGLYVWDSTLGGTAADSPRNRSPVLPFRSPLAQKPRSDRFGRDNGDRFQRRTLIAFPGESLIGFGRIRRMPPIEPVFIPRCAAPVWGRRRDSQAIRVR